MEGGSRLDHCSPPVGDNNVGNGSPVHRDPRRRRAAKRRPRHYTSERPFKRKFTGTRAGPDGLSQVIGEVPAGAGRMLLCPMNRCWLSNGTAAADPTVQAAHLTVSHGISRRFPPKRCSKIASPVEERGRVRPLASRDAGSRMQGRFVQGRASWKVTNLLT